MYALNVNSILRTKSLQNCTRWTTVGKPYAVSVNVKRQVLVTCPEVGKVKVFDAAGVLVHDIVVLAPGIATALGPRFCHVVQAVRTYLIVILPFSTLRGLYWIKHFRV